LFMRSSLHARRRGDKSGGVAAKTPMQLLREAVIRLGVSDGSHKAGELARAIEAVVDDKIGRALDKPGAVIRDRR
jgi:hypothetical protein